MTHRVKFDVPFVKTKARPRFTRQGRTYTPKETQQAEQAVALAWREACLKEFGTVYTIPKGVPVYLTVTFIRPLPKSRPKKVESEPDVYMPDIDNLVKLVLDGLSKGEAWADDSQVIGLVATKVDRIRNVNEATHVALSWEGE